MGNRRGDAGFTLIELMIVIAIIAIIAAIAIPNLLAAKLSANETAAIATLRNLFSSQTQLQGSGRIDADNDAAGEYGTLLELTGKTGVRKGFTYGAPSSSTFGAQGRAINPAILSPSLAAVDANGYVTKAGYAFIVFLPDASTPALWVHEVNSGTVDSPTPGLSNSGLGSGTTSVGVDQSEMMWCAYALPISRNNSGVRVFVTSQSGDLLQSANDVALHEGTATVINPQSAYTGTGITSLLALGTSGADGDVWKVTN